MEANRRPSGPRGLTREEDAFLGGAPRHWAARDHDRRSDEQEHERGMPTSPPGERALRGVPRNTERLREAS
jgi:hypothetical protein